ncbi:Uncharacterized protein dnm_060750 [Desulfonema magnum]|uniref:Uncharacterized protein n=1 Tax=Desulfonema magnum TaxID=45655 RepID=A0A975GQL0_9BACT|nr:Uncharacterized protein dnm_060750 [Desulfonema magnum]
MSIPGEHFGVLSTFAERDLPLPDGICNPVRNVCCLGPVNISAGVSEPWRGICQSPASNRRVFYLLRNPYYLVSLRRVR